MMKAGGVFYGVAGHSGFMLLERQVAFCIENCTRCELVFLLTIQYTRRVPHECWNISIQ